MTIEALDRSVIWLTDRRKYFKVGELVSGEELLRRLKPIGELVLLMEKLTEHGWDCNEISRWAWVQFRRGALFREIIIAKPDLIVLSTIFASFKRLGFQDEKTERVLHYFLTSDYCKGIEMPTWRRLDVSHASWKLGIREFSDLTLSGTWISHHPEPWLVSSDIAYAVTHEIFYLTDFGRMPPRISTADRNFLEISILSWLRIFAMERNFDLVAELLMCSAYLDLLHICDTWEHVLLAHQRDDGCFPGPIGSAADIIDTKMSSSEVDFLQNYHTTLVGSLALAAIQNCRAKSTDTSFGHQ